MFSLEGFHWILSRYSSDLVVCQHTEVEIADSAALLIPMNERKGVKKKGKWTIIFLKMPVDKAMIFFKVLKSPWVEPVWKQAPACTGWSPPYILPSWMAGWGTSSQTPTSGSLWPSRKRWWMEQRPEPGPGATHAPWQALGCWRAAPSPFPWQQGSVRGLPPPQGPSHHPVLPQPRISTGTTTIVK